MYIIAERDMIKSAIRGFIKMWGEDTYPADHRGIKVGYELSNLNQETCSVEEVNALIGNNSWTFRTCSECSNKVKEVICVGHEPDYESQTAYLCKQCLIKAHDLFIKENQ